MWEHTGDTEEPLVGEAVLVQVAHAAIDDHRQLLARQRHVVHQLRACRTTSHNTQERAIERRVLAEFTLASAAAAAAPAAEVRQRERKREAGNEGEQVYVYV